MNNILVTGYNGFIGTEVVKQLLKLGKNVTGLSRSKSHINIHSFQVDITNYNKLMDKLKNNSFDCIMHLASLPGDNGNPLEVININMNGTLHLLEYARKYNVKRFILASSISAYEWYPGTKFNPPEYLPVDEKYPCRPKDIYSSSKLMQELLTMNYFYQYGLPITILRLTAVIGPEGKGGGRSWYKFAEDLKSGEKIQIPHFSKEELCHYVDIRDVARMFIAAAENPKAIGEIFNCAGPAPTRGSEFKNIVKKLVPGIKVEYGFPWSMAQGGEIEFDMSKAEKLINFKPIYTLSDSLKNIKIWIDSGGLREENLKDKKYRDGVKK